MSVLLLLLFGRFSRLGERWLKRACERVRRGFTQTSWFIINYFLPLPPSPTMWRAQQTLLLPFLGSFPKISAWNQVTQPLFCCLRLDIFTWKNHKDSGKSPKKKLWGNELYLFRYLVFISQFSSWRFLFFEMIDCRRKPLVRSPSSNGRAPLLLVDQRWFLFSTSLLLSSSTIEWYLFSRGSSAGH